MSRQQSLSQSIARIGRLIHSTLDFDEIMERVIAEAARAVGSERAALSLREGSQWVVRYVHGFPRAVIGTRMDDTQEPHAVLAIETKKPVVIDEAFTDARVNREQMKQWGVRSVLVVPLVTEDQAVGVLFFNRHQAEAPFSRSHVRFAGRLACSLALAVRNARLCARLQAELAERKKDERALAAGHRQMAEVLGSIQDGFFTVDRDWCFVYVNPRAAGNLGLKPEDLVGKNLWERFPGIVGTPHETSYRRAMETREMQRFEMRGVLTEQWYSITAYPSDDGISVYWQDITPRKQMEAELRRLNERLEAEVQAQTEELRDSVDRLQAEVVRRVLAEGQLRKNSRLLEAFFQHTITPLAFLDKSFSFVRVNEAFAVAAGKPASYFVHKHHFTLYPSAEDQVIFEQVVQSRQPYQAFARPFPYFDKPQQPTRYWNWRITPLLDDKGQVQFLVFNLEDVTEQQHAFGELEHRADLLQRLTLELSQAEDRERRRLAEILHDDLQQVLAAAKFHLGLLKSRVKSDEETKELADQLTRMLKESIEKSRSLSHELSPAVLYQGDLGETFEWLARQVQAKHGLTVHTEVHGKVDTASEPLKAFLFRAAQEILFNTVKHAHVPEARLRLQRRHGQLWLTIADRGRGFDARMLGRTVGFGLFSIRERVKLLGGRMKIHSAKDRGSVIVIAIADEAGGQTTDDGRQTAHENAVLGPSSSVLRSPSTTGPLRILLVDDHKVMRAGLAALITEQADMEVVGQAGDGCKAVELAHELQPDVVIMDVAMPMMPGDEAARQIKATLPQARIIALSMFEEPGVARRMRNAGAEVYLPKTGPSEGLLAAIRGKGGELSGHGGWPGRDERCALRPCPQSP